MQNYLESNLSGWGNFSHRCARVFRPEKGSDLLEVLKSADRPPLIMRGMGRSYGDAAMNEGTVILGTRLNRFLEFDEDRRLLRCEGGVSLDEIIRIFLPRGYILPVVPGTRYVTVGGAIANDIHGKGHHRAGTFSRYVRSFRLLLASGEIVECSRDEHPDWFWATVGGLGLTGIILDAQLDLKRITSPDIAATFTPCSHLLEVLERMEAQDADYEYSVAWIDGMHAEPKLGRAVLMQGNHAESSDVDRLARWTPPRTREFPNAFPSAMLNRWGARLFNEVYFRTQGRRGQTRVDYHDFFFPLDAWNNWNRAYGKHGFLQYQLVLPPDTSIGGLTRVLKLLSDSRQTSFLGVLKRFGSRGEGLLSFPHSGYTLALDLPASGPRVLDLCHQLDRIVMENGGRVYLAKDVRLTLTAFDRMYPKADRFREIQRELDPKGLFASTLSERLGLTETGGRT